MPRLQSNDNAELVQSKKVLEMLTVANEYCLFVEKIDHLKKDDMVLYFSRLTPLLYLKGSLLPDFEIADTDANERFVTEEQWLELYKKVKSIFGKDNVFSCCDGIRPGDCEIINMEVSELIADLYQDFKDFVLLYQKDSYQARENAVYACRELFKNNWGEKTLSLLKVMHHLIFEGKY